MPNKPIAERPKPVVLTMPLRDVCIVFLIGALIGVVTLALYYMLDKYVFTPTLCSADATSIGRCENKLVVSSGLASVLAAFLGVFMLIRQRVYRPLLVAIVATAATWSLVTMISGLQWYVGILVMALVFGFSYSAFSWLVQIRNFLLSIVVSIVLIVVVRLLLVS